MAIRPFAFGLRLRDRERTLRVRGRASQRFVLEETREGRAPRRREHASLASALRDAAASWRARLN